MTGYATGPHLDYRVKKGNTFVNPRKISLPPAQPVTNTNMASFIDLRDRHLARLSSVRAVDDAANVAIGAAIRRRRKSRGSQQIPVFRLPLER